MNYIHLCPKHFTGVYNQIEDKDETKCKFCLSELRERMKKFGIVDWKEEMEEDKKKYIDNKNK